MFHVKRDPVEKPPPEFRPAGDQVVDFRIDHLQRQCLSKRRRPCRALSAYPHLKTVTAVSYANRH